ncbi:hypothetical protein HDU89_003736 [Geranomyces variabilis]|nr:hypothetical protein HDU89_003736 [Geranomyces variabilis]
MLFSKSIAPLALFLAAASVSAQSIAQTRCSNGQAAQQADAAKSSITASSSCNVGDSTCVGDLFGQCVGGKFVTTACAGGLKCQILPLVNKAGTSVACTTDADKTARIADSLGNCNGGGAAAPAPQAPAPAAPATPPPAAPAAGSGAKGAGNKKGTQFITGPCSSDADCASACCGFKSGKCAGPVIAQERDGGCGFGDAQPNDTAARIFRGQQAAGTTPAAPAPAPPAKAPAAPAPPATTTAKKGTQFITGPCKSDADCASACCGFNSGKCAGPVIAQERDGGCGFGDAKPNDTAARIFRGQSPA